MEVLHRGSARYEIREIQIAPIGYPGVNIDRMAERMATSIQAGGGDVAQLLSKETEEDGLDTYTFAVYWRDDMEVS